MVSNKVLTNIVFTIVTILFSIPIFAGTKDIKSYMFINKTHDDFFSLSVGGYCTVSDIGFFSPGGGLGVRPDVFLKNCYCNCDVAIHLTKDCSGPIIGSVFLDASGIISVDGYIANYTITYRTVNPGPYAYQQIFVKNFP